MRKQRTVRVGTVDVLVERLVVADEYAGMLEGTPRLHRRFALRRLDAHHAEPGGHVHGIDGIRADAESGVDEWMPRECCAARLRVWGGGYGAPSRVLDLWWFQDAGDDPYARLAEAAAGLDWTAVSREEPYDD